MCSVLEVKKSKPKKQTNKQLLKVWFAYYLTLYWDFWYFDNSLVIFFQFKSTGCPLPWNPFQPPMSPLNPFGPFEYPMALFCFWWHHLWTPMWHYGTNKFPNGTVWDPYEAIGVINIPKGDIERSNGFYGRGHPALLNLKISLNYYQSIKSPNIRLNNFVCLFVCFGGLDFLTFMTENTVECRFYVNKCGCSTQALANGHV